MFLKARKLVPTHHRLLLRSVASLRERTARDRTLQDPLGLVRNVGLGLKEGVRKAPR